MRSCLNSGRIRALTSRSADAQSSNVLSIDAPDTTISESSHGSASIQRTTLSATVMLEPVSKLLYDAGKGIYERGWPLL